VARRDRAPKLLSKQELEKLTDLRLIAYRDRLYKVPEGPSYEETMYGGIDLQMHKQRPEWKAAIADIKAVLATRGHIERV